MKKVIFLVVSALMALFMSGCAGKQQLEPNPVYNNTRENNEEFIGIYQEEASSIQKLAIALKIVSEKFDEKGYKYFYIEKSGFPIFLTDIKSVDTYCFPEHNGFHIDDTKSSSFESGKCSGIEETIKGKKKNLLMTFVPIKEPIVGQPTWSVKQVVNDTNINKYIEAMLEDGKYENKNIKQTQNIKEYYNSIK